MISLVPVSVVLASRGSGTRPSPTIDSDNHDETNYWASRLNVSNDDLFEAIRKVGPSVAAVRRHLGA